MAQNINQFAPTNQKGQLVNDKAASTTMCIFNPDSLVTLVPGTAVKIVDLAGYSLPVVDKAASTEVIFGFVPYEIKKNVYNPSDILAIASFGQEMYMEASANIAGGATVEIVAAGDTVITAGGAEKIVGINMINVGSGGLTRVLIQTPKINQV